MLCSQYFPAWFLGTFPERRVILTSYEFGFARSWGRKARDVLSRFGGLFGVSVSRDAGAAHGWEIAGKTGGMDCAGAGGAITGKGADLLIIDDPYKNDEDAFSATRRENVISWFQSVAHTRLHPSAAVIVIMTRWHQEDLVGHLVKSQAEPGAEKWQVLSLPAIAKQGERDGRYARLAGEALWPERFPLPWLEEKKVTVGPYFWSALYDQDPTAEGGSEWPAEYFGESIWFQEWPRLIYKVVALDPSKGADSKVGDYRSIVLLGMDEAGNLWCDCDLARQDVSQIIEDVLQYNWVFQPSAVAVEINAFQELIGADLIRVSKERRQFLPAYGITNTVNKRVRIRTLGPLWAQGKIRVRNTPGGRLLVQQLKNFPSGHDDGPDGLEMAVRMLTWVARGKVESRDAPKLLRV